MSASAARLREGALEVARRLRAAGHEAWFAGGCVRDHLLGRAPKDYDVVTDALPDRVASLFRRAVMVGAAFGVVRVSLGKGLEYEVATYREDGSYLDGRHPDEVRYSTSKASDVERRDFTINALLMDPESGEILDLVGGRADLAAGLIRAVGDPERRFHEDRLRMLRAVRFAARFDFAIEPATFEAIRRHAGGLGAVSVERRVGELDAIWGGPRPGLGARLLIDTGLVGVALPFVPAEAYGELVERITRLEALAEVDAEARARLAWAAALDLAPEVDAAATLRGLRASRERLRLVLALLDGRAAWRAPEALRLAERVRCWRSPERELALAFLRVIGGSEEILARWAELGAELEARPLPVEPLVGGADLKALGLPPGPHFKAMLAAVEDEVFERRIGTRAEALERLRQLAATHAGG